MELFIVGSARFFGSFRSDFRLLLGIQNALNWRNKFGNVTDETTAEYGVEINEIYSFIHCFCIYNFAGWLEMITVLYSNSTLSSATAIYFLLSISET